MSAVATDRDLAVLRALGVRHYSLDRGVPRRAVLAPCRSAIPTSSAATPTPEARAATPAAAAEGPASPRDALGRERWGVLGTWSGAKKVRG